MKIKKGRIGLENEQDNYKSNPNDASEEQSFINIRDRVREEFVDDPLFITCLREPETKDDLFPDFLDLMKRDISWNYSIKEVTPWLKRRDSAIRFYINEFKGYVNAFMVSNSYRLRYDDVYKLYLINLYIIKLDKPLSDAKNIVNKTAEIITNKPTLEGKRKIPDDLLFEVLKGIQSDANNMRQDTADMFFGIVEAIKSDKEKDLELEYLRQDLSSVQASKKAATIKLESVHQLLKLRREIAYKDLLAKRKEELGKEKFENLGFFKKFKPVIVNDDEVEVSREEIESHTEVVALKDDIQALEEQIEALTEEEKEKKEKLNGHLSSRNQDFQTALSGIEIFKESKEEKRLKEPINYGQE